MVAVLARSLHSLRCARPDPKGDSFRRAVGGGSAPAATPGPLPADRNGDGEVVVACLGDSNTQSDWQIEIPGGFPAARVGASAWKTSSEDA
jgi:hypothetical protein